MNFNRVAENTITAANLLLKSGSDSTLCDLCGTSDTPIGISTGHVKTGWTATIQPLADDAVTLVASGAIAFGDDIGLAADGRVASYSSGLKVGKAVATASAAGDPIEVILIATSVASGSSTNLIGTAVPTADPGVGTGQSAFYIRYSGSFLGLYYWTGAAWEQVI